MHGYYTIQSSPSEFLKTGPSPEDLVLYQLPLLTAVVHSDPCTGHQPLIIIIPLMASCSCKV